jgi:hypothetical protein
MKNKQDLLDDSNLSDIRYDLRYLAGIDLRGFKEGLSHMSLEDLTDRVYRLAKDIVDAKMAWDEKYNKNKNK